MLEKLDHFEQIEQSSGEVVLMSDSPQENAPISPKILQPPISYLVNTVCSSEEVDKYMEYYGSCGKWVTGKEKNGDLKINTVLSSERYLSESSVSGDRNDYFMQYHEGYRGQGEGIYNPKSVAWSGSDETIRVLKVEWHAATEQINAHYLAAKDMRYNIEDYRRFKDNQMRQMRLDQIRQELSDMSIMNIDQPLDMAAD